MEFRCGHCGGWIVAEVQPGRSVGCAHCGRPTEAPEGLATLPRPQWSPEEETKGLRTGEREPSARANPEAGDGDREVRLSFALRSAPWLISLVVHALVLAVLSLFIFFVHDDQSDALVIPDARLTASPGGDVVAGEMDLSAMAAAEPLETTVEQVSQMDDRVDTDSNEGAEEPLVIGLDAGAMGGGPMASLGVDAGGGAAGPRSEFYGVGGNAYHIVYVVDCSGSMSATFDLVCLETLRSISGLQPSQRFHLIFFSSGEPIENPPRRLVPATDTYRLQAARFMEEIYPKGQTDPIPALRRAFAVLARADSGRGKLIYLLTDGEFPDNAAVLTALGKLNHGRTVAINTILHQHQSPKAERVLQDIAERNGGRYRFVEEQ